MKKTIISLLSAITMLAALFSVHTTAFAQDDSQPAAPELYAAAQTESTITLAWSAADTAIGYEIYQYSENESYQLLAAVDAATTQYTVYGLESAEDYQFAVRAYNAQSYSEYSNILAWATQPSQPWISSAKVSGTTITVNFVSNPGCSGYQISYGVSPSTDSYTMYAGAGTKSVQLKNLKALTGYSIHVRAYKTINGQDFYGPWSDIATATTKPPVVTVKSISSPSTTSVKINWSKVTCSGYQVQYSTSKNFSSGNKTVNVAKDKTSYTISKLKNNKTYYVRIRSYVTKNGKKVYGVWTTKSQKTYPAKKIVVSTSVMQSAAWSSKSLCSVKKNKSVRVISQSGRWYKVIYSGKTGYVYNLAFKKSGSSNLSRSKVTTKNYKTYLDDIIFKTGKDKKKLFSYVVNNMSYSYSKISSAQKKANINSLDKVKKNEAVLTTVAITKRGGICYNYAAFTKTLLQRAGYNVQYIYGSNRNGAHCWVLIKTDGKYRHLDAVRNAYLFTDKQMSSSSKTRDFKWDKSKYPECK